MAELNPPWAIENRADHDSNVNRMMLQLLGCYGEGVPNAASLAVTQRGAGANMSVDVAAGSCIVFGDENRFQGVYGCVNDATKNVVVSTADGTNPRRDLIVARVRDSFYSGATDAWDLTIITGTPAASPADPTPVTDNCLVLARVAVAAGATSITNANITDLRPKLPLGVIPGNSARAHRGTLYGAYSAEADLAIVTPAGQMRYDTDTNMLYVYNGTQWVCITPNAATVATGQTTTSTSFADLATVGPAVSLLTGTKALVSVGGHGSNNVADGWRMGFAVSGATTVAAADGFSIGHQDSVANLVMDAGKTMLVTGLTPGVNTFTQKYRVVGASTGTFQYRFISVVGLP